AEHSAVNRGVAGSSPARGARFQAADFGGFFVLSRPRRDAPAGSFFVSNVPGFEMDIGLRAQAYGPPFLSLILEPTIKRVDVGVVFQESTCSGSRIPPWDSLRFRFADVN